MKKLLVYLITIFIISGISIAQIDRSKIPQPGPAPAAAFPNYDLVKTKNGMRIILVKNDEIPTITFSLSIDHKPILEKEFVGSIDIMGQLLRTGTKTRSKEQLDREIDFLGANISSSGTSIYGNGLSKYQEKILELMSDILLNPSFPETELEKIKEQTISGLKYSKSDPNMMINFMKNKVLYGLEHPYGEMESEETVGKITVDKCKESYNLLYKPNYAIMAIVGHFDKKEILNLIDKYFGSWKKGTIKENNYPEPKQPEKTNIALIDRSSSVQSVIDVCQVVKLPSNSPDKLAAQTMNTILGGGIFRLFLNLREKHAFTYGAYSDLKADNVIGEFSASTSVRNSVTDSALTEIFYEINRIRNEKVEEKELKMAKNYMSGSFVLSLEDPQTIANYAISIEKNKLPKDYYKTYLKRLEAIKDNDIIKAAKKYLQPDKMTIAIVGNGSEIKDRIAKFGKIEMYDEEGNKIVKKQDTKTDLTADQIIEKYIENTGGAAKYESLTDQTITLKGNMQNFDITVKIVSKSPNKFYTETAVGQMFKQEIAIDGESGWQKGMQGLADLPEEAIKSMKKASLFNFHLKYKDAGISAELKGIKSIKGIEHYEIEYKYDGKTISREFFGKDDFLKYREIVLQKGPQGEMESVIDYSEYKDYGGLKVPTVMEQMAMGQTLKLTLEKFETNTNVDNKLFSKPQE